MWQCPICYETKVTTKFVNFSDCDGHKCRICEECLATATITDPTCPFCRRNVSKKVKAPGFFDMHREGTRLSELIDTMTAIPADNEDMRIIGSHLIVLLRQSAKYMENFAPTESGYKIAEKHAEKLEEIARRMEDYSSITSDELRKMKTDVIKMIEALFLQERGRSN